MERIRSLAGLALMIAIVMLGATWVNEWYTRSEEGIQAYAQFNEHMQRIYQEINLNGEYEPFMSEEVFTNGMADEALAAYVDAWLSDVSQQRSFSQETLDAVKEEIIALYDSQRALARDSVLYRYIWTIRVISGTVIVLSLLIIWLIRKKLQLGMKAMETNHTRKQA